MFSEIRVRHFRYDLKKINNTEDMPISQDRYGDALFLNELRRDTA